MEDEYRSFSKNDPIKIYKRKSAKVNFKKSEEPDELKVVKLDEASGDSDYHDLEDYENYKMDPSTNIDSDTSPVEEYITFK